MGPTEGAIAPSAPAWLGACQKVLSPKNVHSIARYFRADPEGGSVHSTGLDFQIPIVAKARVKQNWYL